jgi:hypothetical protein
MNDVFHCAQVDNVVHAVASVRGPSEYHLQSYSQCVYESDITSVLGWQCETPIIVHRSFLQTSINQSSRKHPPNTFPSQQGKVHLHHRHNSALNVHVEVAVCLTNVFPACSRIAANGFALKIGLAITAPTLARPFKLFEEEKATG